MKKALSLLLAAILAAACFATVGAAADAAVTLNNTDYPGVKVLNTNLDLSVLTDGDKGESLKGIAWADTDKTKIIAFQIRPPRSASCSTSAPKRRSTASPSHFIRNTT